MSSERKEKSLEKLEIIVTEDKNFIKKIIVEINRLSKKKLKYSLCNKTLIYKKYLLIEKLKHCIQLKKKKEMD